MKAPLRSDCVVLRQCRSRYESARWLRRPARRTSRRPCLKWRAPLGAPARWPATPQKSASRLSATDRNNLATHISTLLVAGLRTVCQVRLSSHVFSDSCYCKYYYIAIRATMMICSMKEAAPRVLQVALPGARRIPRGARSMMRRTFRGLFDDGRGKSLRQSHRHLRTCSSSMPPRGSGPSSPFANIPLLLGTALLAYSFGLRHAVDADHIAAIDNVTRKLMQEGKRPVAVGLMFSLGHSTVVVLGSAAIAAAALALQHRTRRASVTSAASSAHSSPRLFLFAIADGQHRRAGLYISGVHPRARTARPTSTKISTCSLPAADCSPAFSAPCSP